MKEIDKILYDLGYYDADDLKTGQVQGYVNEAEEFMRESGVSSDVVSSYRAYAVKSLWADARDKGTADKLLREDSIVVSLISNLRRSPRKR